MMKRRFTRLGATLLLLGAMGCGAAFGEDAAPNPAPASPPPAAPTSTPEPSWFTPPAGLACRQWSDGCHVCIRASADAETSCSTPSIACVQTASQCLEPQHSAQ
jgi:hypothetical protein